MTGKPCADESAAARPAGPAVPQAKVLAMSVAQLLEDQAAHIARFRQLRSKLQSDAFACDNALLTHSVQGLLDAARSLDLQTLANRGWWARLTGASAGAAQKFRAGYAKVLSAAAGARHAFEALSRDDRAHTSSARKLIVELDIESRALTREIDRGAEWLVELSFAVTSAGDSRALSACAMDLCTDLKRFRAVSALAREIVIVGQRVLERRAALLQMVKIDLLGFDRIWAARLCNVEARAGDPHVPSSLLEHAREAHGQLLARLESTAAAFLALQTDEQFMARRLAMFAQCLEEPPASSVGIVSTALNAASAFRKRVTPRADSLPACAAPG